MKKISANRLVKLATVTALYVALTLSLSFISYGNIQFRVAEMLMLLCFYRKDYGISLILGCFIANIFSPMMLWDMLFGTLATALSVLVIYISPNIYLASLAPVVFNGLIVGFELYKVLSYPFWISCLEVAAGEFVCVCIVGVIVFRILEKNERFMNLIKN